MKYCPECGKLVTVLGNGRFHCRRCTLDFGLDKVTLNPGNTWGVLYMGDGRKLKTPPMRPVSRCN